MLLGISHNPHPKGAVPQCRQNICDPYLCPHSLIYGDKIRHDNIMGDRHDSGWSNTTLILMNGAPVSLPPPIFFWDLLLMPTRYDKQQPLMYGDQTRWRDSAAGDPELRSTGRRFKSGPLHC